METKVENVEDGLVRLTVTVAPEEVDRAVAATYKRVASKLRISGFRAGKAPRPIVEGHVGRDNVLAEAQEAIVNETYPAALDAEDLRTVGQPDLGELELPREGEAYTYVAEVRVRPQLALSSDEPVSVEIPSRAVTDAEVERQIEIMRERFATLEPVTDRGAGPDDFVLLSFTGLVDGESYEGNSVDKYLYEMGRGLMPEEFDDAVLGAGPGDSSKAEFVIPESSSNPEFVGRKAAFDITVHEVKAKIMPEADDEFAGNVGGFDTIQELRDDMRRRLSESRELAHMQTIEREARRALAERVEGEVPQAMVDSAKDAMTRDFFNSLEARGITLKDYVNATDVDPEQIERDIAEQAERSVREELALEALFRAKGMEVADEDVDASLAEMGGGDRPVEELRERWRAAGVLPVVREQVMHRKAVEWLIDNVTVVEREPGPDGDNETPAAGGEDAPKASSGKKTPRRKKKADTAERAEKAPEPATGQDSEE
ncbi:MAG: trigger factor [Coriobacteriia bacterium]|nr:trigger factor [Coriobacteriia bacterium]